MNPAVLFFGVSGFSPKKFLIVLLATAVVVISLPVIVIVSMGSDVASFLSSTPNAEAAQTDGFYMGGAVAGDTYAWGNCTYWAYAMRLWAGDPIPTTWGNANTWAIRAQADGYVVDHTPSVNAVFETTAGDLGHVAYVIKVDDTTGEWTISEMNAPHLNVVDTRTFPASAAQYYNFIHDKQGAVPWKPSTISIPSLGVGK